MAYTVQPNLSWPQTIAIQPTILAVWARPLSTSVDHAAPGGQVDVFPGTYAPQYRVAPARPNFFFVLTLAP